MSDAILRSFLDDIKGHPDDDTRRLIFADWLEENSDTEAERARGEFVRLQVRLAPLALEEETAGERADRVRAWELQHRHQAEWIGELADAGLGEIRFVRGLVRVSLSAEMMTGDRLAHLAGSRQWPWVSGLHVHGEPDDGGFTTPADWVVQLRDWQSLDGIRELALEWLGFGERHATTLGRWPGLGRLHVLNLRTCAVLSQHQPLLLGSHDMTHLRRLGVNFYSHSTHDLVALLRSRPFTDLTHLRLACDGTEILPLQWLAGAACRTQLRSLTLEEIELTDARLELLRQIDLPCLRSLRFIRSDHLEANFLPWLQRTTWVRQLTELGFDWPSYSGGLFRPLLDVVGRKGPKHLRSLIASSCGLSAGEMASLLGAWRAPTPRVLDLRGNNLGPDGILYLGLWPKLRTVHRLDLRDNELTTPALQRLLKSPNLSPWAELDLRGNRPSAKFRETVAGLGRPIRV